jgi:hypothetical protein
MSFKKIAIAMTVGALSLTGCSVVPTDGASAPSLAGRASSPAGTAESRSEERLGAESDAPTPEPEAEAAAAAVDSAPVVDAANADGAAESEAGTDSAAGAPAFEPASAGAATAPASSRPTPLTPTSIPSSVPTATRTPTPTPPPTATQSPTSVPVGDLPGWKQTLAEDFTTAATSAQFDSTYAKSWCGYDDGTAGIYFKDVVSAHDGQLDFSLDGVKGAAGSFGPPSTCWGKTYGRFSIRFKAVDGINNGTAMMLWPSSNVWGDGEIDYPEGSLNDTFSVFHHPMNCSDCSSSDSLNTRTTFRDWHIATTEWLPTSVKYYLDGQLIKTVTHDVPTTDHRMTLQVAPVAPNAQPGHLLVDWVAQWDRA